MQLPSNMILTRVRPSLFLPFWVCVWSCISAATAAVHNFPGLIAVRFFLGEWISGERVDGSNTTDRACPRFVLPCRNDGLVLCLHGQVDQHKLILDFCRNFGSPVLPWSILSIVVLVHQKRTGPPDRDSVFRPRSCHSNLRPACSRYFCGP